MKNSKLISLALILSIICFITDASAKGRTGSHRVGGKNSHGKGNHYVGGRR